MSVHVVVITADALQVFLPGTRGLWYPAHAQAATKKKEKKEEQKDDWWQEGGVTREKINAMCWMKIETGGRVYIETVRNVGYKFVPPSA